MITEDSSLQRRPSSVRLGTDYWVVAQSWVVGLSRELSRVLQAPNCSPSHLPMATLPELPKANN